MGAGNGYTFSPIHSSIYHFFGNDGMILEYSFRGVRGVCVCVYMYLYFLNLNNVIGVSRKCQFGRCLSERDVVNVRRRVMTITS